MLVQKVKNIRRNFILKNYLTENNIENLKKIIGKELKYKSLCEAINIPVKGGDAKKSQIKDLQTYCSLSLLENPTRFIVEEVYDGAFEVINGISGNNKFQAIFDAALYHALIKNHGNPLYVSGLELIRLFQEVNDNFGATLNINILKKIGNEYVYMNNMSDIVYRVLKQWTEHKLNSMNTRGVIRLSTGYRLYKKIHGPKGDFYSKYDVPQSTKNNVNELDQLCMTVYNKTHEECFPFLQESYIQNKLSKKEKVSYFIPGYKLKFFNDELNKAISEATNGEYCKMKRVKVITPPQESWLQEKLEQIYKEYPDLNQITNEVYNKVLTIKQLDDFTGNERKLYAKMNIDRNPSFLFQNRLQEIEEGKRKETNQYV